MKGCVSFHIINSSNANTDDQISAKEIRQVLNNLTGEKYCLIRTGGLGLLSTLIKITRVFSLEKTELNPAWKECNICET